MTVNFSPPDIRNEDIEEVVKVLRSGWITTGPITKQLENKIAAFIGASRCVCLSSQTACAQMTLRLLGIGPGDECITSAYTYTASASVVCHVGATLKLVDTQQDSIEMDYDSLEAAITEQTKVIIPVDLAGIPCDYDRIFEIVERKKHLFRPANDIQRAIGRVIVMADAAHALGAEYHGDKVGTIADFSCFSFHAVKNFTTAEGGCVTWRSVPGISDEDIYYRYQLLSLHGQSKDAFNKNSSKSWEYDVMGTWYKCNMTDVAAAMGICQLERYPDGIQRRLEIIARYNEAFQPLGLMMPEHVNEEHISSGHLYITRIPGISSVKRNEIIDKMIECGISCNVHYKPLPLLTAYRDLGFSIENYPNAKSYFENEITLPLHTSLTDEMVSYVIQTYTAIVKEYLQ